MSDVFWQSFWSNIGGVLAIVVPSIISLVSAIYARKSVKVTEVCSTNIESKAEAARLAAVEARTELSAKVDAVQGAATRSHHEITQAFMAGKREGYVGGIQEGKKQATGPMPLGK